MILILFFGFISAKSVDEENFDVMDLLDDGEFIEAYEVLDNMYNKKHFNNQTIFLLGTTAIKLQKFDEAEEYFKYILKNEPNNPRVMLELGNLYFGLKRIYSSQNMFNNVEIMNPPKEVQDNINKYKDLINKLTQHQFQGNIAFGYGYDSNINSGPISKEFNIYINNNPYPVTMDSSSDHIKYSSISINHKKMILDNVSWMNNIAINKSNVINDNSFDTTTKSIMSGVVYESNKLLVSIPFTVSRLVYGHTTRYLSDTYSIVPNIMYNANNKIMYNINILFDKTRYLDRTGDNKKRALSLGLNYNFNQSSIFNSGYTYTYTNSKKNEEDSSSNTFNISWTYVITPELMLNINRTNIYTYYKENSIFYANQALRKDIMNISGLGISYIIKKLDMTISITHNYTHNISNIDMNAYRKKLTSINISKSF
jgi:tetratricopeptide (TPR) repeat protein